MCGSVVISLPEDHQCFPSPISDGWTGKVLRLFSVCLQGGRDEVGAQQMVCLVCCSDSNPLRRCGSPYPVLGISGCRLSLAKTHMRWRLDPHH